MSEMNPLVRALIYVLLLIIGIAILWAAPGLMLAVGLITGLAFIASGIAVLMLATISAVMDVFKSRK